MRNQVRMIGNLGMNPEVKVLDSGKKVVKMQMAVNESAKNAKGEKVKNTQWFTLTAWGRTAENMEKYLEKGSSVAVEGKLHNGNYTDKNGVKHYFTEVLVNGFSVLKNKN